MPQGNRAEVGNPHNEAGRNEPGARGPFASKWKRAFERMLESPHYASTLLRFQEAYTLRKQSPWLGESRNADGTERSRKQDGVAYAIRYALEKYLIPTQLDPAQSISEPYNMSSATNDDEILFQAVLESAQFRAWLDKLKTSTNAVVREGTSIELFEEELIAANIDTQSISQVDLQAHIAAALMRYHEHREIGLSRDPL
ncbi:MAG TPA: hypothetical protein VGE45_19520 [Chloroflexia bacterium]|jgi:hypothetical protein